MNLNKYLNEGSNEVKGNLSQAGKYITLAISQAKKADVNIKYIEELQDIAHQVSQLRGRF